MYSDLCLAQSKKKNSNFMNFERGAVLQKTGEELAGKQQEAPFNFVPNALQFSKGKIISYNIYDRFLPPEACLDSTLILLFWLQFEEMH